MAGVWPGAGLRLSVRSGRWFGLGEGYGQLRGRQVEVAAEGRGAADRTRTARLWLPDEHGAARPVEAAELPTTAPARTPAPVVPLAPAATAAAAIAGAGTAVAAPAVTRVDLAAV